MELSNFVWDQKNKSNDVSLESSILDTPGSRNCMLCVTEKYHILFLGLNLLNKRNELVSKCRRENKYYLSNYNSVTPWQVAKLDDFLYWTFLQRYCPLTLNKKLSNQLGSMSHVESGYPQLVVLFFNIVLCIKYSKALLSDFRVLYGISCRLKIVRCAKLVVTT